MSDNDNTLKQATATEHLETTSHPLPPPFTLASKSDTGSIRNDDESIIDDNKIQNREGDFDDDDIPYIDYFDDNENSMLTQEEEMDKDKSEFNDDDDDENVRNEKRGGLITQYSDHEDNDDSNDDSSIIRTKGVDDSEKEMRVTTPTATMGIPKTKSGLSIQEQLSAMENDKDIDDGGVAENGNLIPNTHQQVMHCKEVEEAKVTRSQEEYTPGKHDFSFEYKIHGFTEDTQEERKDNDVAENNKNNIDIDSDINEATKEEKEVVEVVMSDRTYSDESIRNFNQKQKETKLSSSNTSNNGYAASIFDGTNGAGFTEESEMEDETESDDDSTVDTGRNVNEEKPTTGVENTNTSDSQKNNREESITGEEGEDEQSKGLGGLAPNALNSVSAEQEGKDKADQSTIDVQETEQVGSSHGSESKNTQEAKESIGGTDKNCNKLDDEKVVNLEISTKILQRQVQNAEEATDYVEDQTALETAKIDQKYVNEQQTVNTEDASKRNNFTTMTPVNIYSGETQSLPTQASMTCEVGRISDPNDSCIEHNISVTGKESSDGKEFESKIDSLNGESSKLIQSPQKLQQNLGIGNSVAESDDSYYNALTMPIESPASKSQLISTDTQIQHVTTTKVSGKDTSLHPSQHEKVETVESKSLPNNKDAEETKENSEENQNQAPLAESVAVGPNTKLDNSLLGPTPTQPHDMLSYPRDYMEKFKNEKLKGTEEKIKVVSRKKSDNGGTGIDKDQNDSQRQSAAISSSGTTPMSQNLLENLPVQQDGGPMSVVKKIHISDNIIDSQADSQQIDEVDEPEKETKARKPIGPSHSFLPPFPGKRLNSHTARKEVEPKQTRETKNIGAPKPESSRRNRWLEYQQRNDENDEDIDDIVEDPSQTQQNGIKTDVANKTRDQLKDNEVNEEEEGILLKDTQQDGEDGEDCRKVLRRVRRGLRIKEDKKNERKKSSKILLGDSGILDAPCEERNEVFDNSDNDDDGNEDYESDESVVSEDSLHDEHNEGGEGTLTLSQNTRDIKSLLHNWNDINVSELKQNLMRPPPSHSESQKKIDSLVRKNKELSQRNKNIVNEKKQLEKKLSKVSAQLKEKVALCNEMKARLDEFWPLIECVQAMGSTQRNSGAKKKKHASSGKKKLQSSKVTANDRKLDDEQGVKSDQESCRQATPRKVLDFQTPQGKNGSEQKGVGIVSVSARKATKKRETKGNITFSALWKALQKRGWKYKSGPEPYDMVYVPSAAEGGSVRRGSVLGRDFFHADKKLWKRAEELGIIDTESNSQDEDSEESSDDEDIENEDIISKVKPRKDPVCVSSPESEDAGNALKKKNGQTKSVALDDTKLCGPSSALTEKSTVKCYSLIEDFLTSEQSHKNFMKDLWFPLWTCIKDEQSFNGEGLGWRYDKSRGAGELGRDYWYCPPISTKGSKGLFGKDYFTTEEAVVAFILRQIKGNRQIQSFIANFNAKLIKDFEVQLSRAIEDHVTYDEIGLSSRKTKRRQRKTPRAECSESLSVKKKKKIIERKPASSGKTKHITMSPVSRTKSQSSSNSLQNDDIMIHSQNTVKGAEILLELNKSSVNTNETKPAQKYECIATKNGIKALLDSRRSKKRKTPMKSPTNEPPRKKGRNSPNSFVCHLTQAAVDSTLNSWVSPTTPKKGANERLPFHGFFFFGSGIGVDVANAVTKLGGKFLSDIKGDQLKRSNVMKKLFFVSNFVNRRTHKYLLANALGVPMLHYEWVHVITNRFRDYKARVGMRSFPDIFDSQLYSEYRLPLGLSTETNLYVLQRASHAKKWKGLINENGVGIFTGLTIVIVLEDPNGEKRWISILELAGATVLRGSQIDKNRDTVDLVLADSLSLPPHVTAVAPKISKVLNKIIMAKKKETLVIDLSWATQCIVRRTRVPISKKYTLQIESSSGGHETILNVIATKVQQFSGLTRYEVGDSVKFGKEKGKLSTGRISAIRFDKKSRKKYVEVKVLELHNENELMDGGKSMATVVIQENDLQGHILILGGKEYSQVAWSKDSGVYVQKKV